MVGILGLQALLGAGQADLEQADAERMLPGDERRATRGAGLLPIAVRKQCTFLCDAVDVRRRAADHAAMVGAEIPDADVIGHDEEDVGFLFFLRMGRAGGPQESCHGHEE